MIDVDPCQGFVWAPTDYGGRLLTPWRYDDGDHIVVFVSAADGDQWRIDDNGEAAFRLSGAGVDLDSERVHVRLAAFPELLGVQWHAEDEELFCIATQVPEIGERALLVAEAAAQLMSLACLVRERKVSDFRERVISVVEQVAAAANLEVRRDVPVDESQTLLVDAWLGAHRPVYVIAATSAQRLMEAEVIWLDAARRQERAFVLALVDDVRAVGVKQYTRANYYTDKTVEHTSDAALRNLVQTTVRQQ